jgi:hypothetical protein
MSPGERLSLSDELNGDLGTQIERAYDKFQRHLNICNTNFTDQRLATVLHITFTNPTR